MTHTHGFYTVSWRNKNIFPTCSVTFIPISGVGWVIRVPQLPWLEILGPFWWRNQVSVRVLCWHALFVLTCPANVGMCASNEPTKKMHSVHYAYKQDTALQKKEWLGIAICCPINCFFSELGFRRPVGSLGDDQSGWWKRLAACLQCSKEFCQVAGSPTIWTRNILLEKPKHMLPDTFTFVKMQPMLCLQPRKNLDGKFHADIFT